MQTDIKINVITLASSLTNVKLEPSIAAEHFPIDDVFV